MFPLGSGETELSTSPGASAATVLSGPRSAYSPIPASLGRFSSWPGGSIVSLAKAFSNKLSVGSFNRSSGSSP